MTESTKGKQTNKFQRLTKREWQDILICIHKTMAYEKIGSKVMNKTIKECVIWSDFERLEEGIRNIIFGKFGDAHEKELARIHQIA